MSRHSLSFWQWLTQQAGREDPIGDLAADAMADCRAGHTEVRSIGGLRARLARLDGCSEAKQALDDALREWRRTKGTPRADIDVLLRLLGLVAQHQPYPDGTRRVVRAEQIDEPTPHPRAYLPAHCSLSEALRFIAAAGFGEPPVKPSTPAQLDAEIAQCLGAIRGIPARPANGVRNTSTHASKTTTLSLKGSVRGDRG
jgi:hypothetical protein